MGRKKSKRNKSKKAQNPSPKPPEPAAVKKQPASEPDSTKNTGVSLLGFASVIGGGLLIAGILFLVFNNEKEDPEQTPPPIETQRVLATDPIPQAPISPQQFKIPPEFNATQRAKAQRALNLNQRALDAHISGNQSQFITLAQQALQAYQEAGWLFDQLGPFHHALIAEYFSRGDLKGAILEGRKWLDKFPNSAEHLETVAKAEYQAGQFQQAAEKLEKFAKLHPNSLRTQRQLASAYEGMGEKEKGLQAVDKCLELIGYPKGPYKSFHQSKITLHTALRVTHRFYHYPRLMELAQAVLDLEPNRLEARMALGVAARQLGHYKIAEKELTAYLSQVEGRPGIPLTNITPSRLELALAKLKQSKTEEAVSTLVDLLVMDPYYTRAYFQLGQALSRLQLTEKAQAFFQRSRDLAPADRELRREIEQRGLGKRALAERAKAKAYFLQGEYEKAEEALQHAIKQSGGSVAVRFYLMEIQWEIGKIPYAQVQLNEIQKQLSKNHPESLGWLARLETARGAYSNSLRILTQLCRTSEPLLKNWGIDLGELYIYKLKDFASAITLLKRYLKLGPHPKATLLLGSAYALNSDYDLALQAFASVPTVDRHYKEGIFLLEYLQALAQRGKPEDLKLAVSLLPQVPADQHGYPHFLTSLEILFNKGVSLENLKDYLKPDEKDASPLRRSQVLKKGNQINLEQAQQESVSATKTTGELASQHYLNASKAYLEMGDRKNSLISARKAWIQSKNSKEVLDHLLVLLDNPADVFLRFQLEHGKGKKLNLQQLDPQKSLLLKSLLQK